MKMGRFVFDSHIHCGKKDSAKADSRVKGIQAEVEEIDNSDMILYDMDAYGIDMGLLLPSFTGTTNEGHAKIVKRHPNRFRSCCEDTQTRINAARGVKAWNIKDAIKEIDDVLTKYPDIFVGIGEFCPGSMGVVRNRPSRYERFLELCEIAEVAVAHDVPMYFHEYSSFNMDEPFSMLYAVCQKYPSFKVVIAHGGGNKPYEIEKACTFAASFNNVYLETGYWKAEYYEYALKDYHVGSKKLIWGGGDTGSRLWYPQSTQPGAKLVETTRVWNNRNNWDGDKREAEYQPDFYGWSTHQIHRLKDLELCTQDEINLIIGGNAARLYKLPINPLITFASGRPDLWLPPAESMNEAPIAYKYDNFDNDIEYIPGTNNFFK